MGKLYKFYISAVLVFGVGCSRASFGDKTKVSISFTKDAFNQNVSGKIEDVSISNLNCFLVMAGGPEELFRKNKCTLRSGAANISSGTEIFFNQWTGGFKYDEVATLEIPSGKDRVLFLVGMTVKDQSSCVDFRANRVPKDENSSRPYIVGTADKLNLEAGETVKIPIKISLDSSTPSLSGCSGPDVPMGSDENSDDSDGPLTPYLRIENIGRFDSAQDVDLGTLNFCYPVGAGIFEGQGVGKFNTSSNPIVINVGTNGLGQFYSSAACSAGSEVNTLEIPPGQFRTNTNLYWFKPTVNAAIPTAMNVTTNITEFSISNYQRFQFGLKKLVILGPDRIVVNDPHVFTLTSRFFEGQLINVSDSSLGIGFTSNASYFLNSSTDCSLVNDDAGTLIPITYSNQNFCFGFLSSMGSVDFRNILSTSIGSGYQIESKIVTSSSGSTLAKNYKMFAESGVLRRGECNELKIQQVNSDGAVVKPLVYHKFRIDIESGAGVFYYDPNCSSINSDKTFVMSAGVRDLPLYFKPNALYRSGGILNRVQFQIRAGYLSTRASRDFTKMTGVGNDLIEIPVSESDSNAVFVPQPPDFGSADFVGSHEFTDGFGPGSFLFVPLIGDYSSVSTALCSADDSEYVECSATEMDKSSIPYLVKWSATKAQTNTAMFVRLKHVDGSLTNSVKIDTNSLYGGRLKVIGCTHYAPSGTTLTLSDIPSPTNLNSVVCLPRNSTYTMSVSSVALNNNLTALIGPSDRSTTLASGSSSGYIISSTTNLAYSAHITVANLNFDSKTLQNYGAIFLDSPATSSESQFILNNLKIVSDQNSKLLIHVKDFSGSNLSAKLENIKVESSGVSATAVHINNSSDITIDKMDLVSTDTAGSGNYVDILNGGDAISVLNSELMFKSGTGIAVDNSLSSSGLNYLISNNRIINFGNNLGNRIFLIKDKVSGSVTNNLILSELDLQVGALLKVVFNTSVPQINLNGNSFINGHYNSPMIEFSGSIAAHALLDFSANSMAYINSASNSSTLGGVFRLPITGSTLTINVSIPASISNAANLVCSRTSNTVGMLTGPGTFVGPWNPGSITIFSNSFDLESGRCGY